MVRKWNYAWPSGQSPSCDPKARSDVVSLLWFLPRDGEGFSTEAAAMRINKSLLVAEIASIVLSIITLVAAILSRGWGWRDEDLGAVVLVLFIFASVLWGTQGTLASSARRAIQ